MKNYPDNMSFTGREPGSPYRDEDFTEQTIDCWCCEKELYDIEQIEFKDRMYCAQCVAEELEGWMGNRCARLMSVHLDNCGLLTIKIRTR